MTVTINGEDYTPGAYEVVGRDPSVVIGWLSAGHPDHMMMMSVLGAIWYDLSYNYRQIKGTLGLMGSPRLPAARNQLVMDFLGLRVGDDGGPADYLLMMDDDMTMEEDEVHRAIGFSQKHDVPILGGLCYAGRPSAPVATVYTETEREDQRTGKIMPLPTHWDPDELPYDTLLEVAATGTGWMLIHRNVLVSMALPHPKGYGTLPNGRPNDVIWFQDYGGTFGEDVAFCMKARAMGAKVCVHTGIEIGHRKVVTMDREYVEAHSIKPEGRRRL